MILECEAYLCSTPSGGKVWGIPNASNRASYTFNGKEDRFYNGKVTINSLSSPKDIYVEIQRKRSKGYTSLGKVWINIHTGEVHQTKPKKIASEIIQEPIKKEIEPVYIFNKPGLFNF